MNVIVTNRHATELSALDIDIIKSVNGEFTPEDLVATFKNFFFNKMIIDITAIKNYIDINEIQKLSVNFDMSKIILLLENDTSSDAAYLSKLISMGIYNFTKNISNIKYLIDNPNSYKDVAHIHQLHELTNTIVSKVENLNCKVIGIKNVTDHAGATTLIYMLKKQLDTRYKVRGIEVGKTDFSLFKDPNLISVTKEDFNKALKSAADFDIVLIDLNDEEDDNCDDTLFLLEPSTIKLNKMIRKDRNIFDKLTGKKIILNKSLLDNNDIMDFEYESKSKVYYNIPPLDDKKSK
ncbi:MAG: hypothetical protein GX663_10825, partial [Clostridiales bacterium]|nr:hypothetical protein [Clostridiales bacterium]